MLSQAQVWASLGQHFDHSLGRLEPACRETWRSRSSVPSSWWALGLNFHYDHWDFRSSFRELDRPAANV